MATLAPDLPTDEAPGVVASLERIDAWMSVAKAADRFVYATRHSLPPRNAGAAYMRELQGRGLVMLFSPRVAPGSPLFNFMAVRTARATAMTRPERPKLCARVAPLDDGEAEAIDALMPVLERFALSGRPCPTNRQLGERAGLSEAAIAATLSAMVAGHLIHVAGATPPTCRRITILGTGAITGVAA